MNRSLFASLPALAILAGCTADQPATDASNAQDRAEENAERNPNFEPTVEQADEASAATNRAAAPGLPLARDLTLAQWGKAENRQDCAPLILLSDGGQAATPRVAHFGGGWGVAFDQPSLRSAYGVAGTGSAVADATTEITRIGNLFPYVRPIGGRVGGLPGGSTAAYGVEGAMEYAADNPDGAGAKSLAYVVIPGQRCLYNVWSQRGRSHLESLLDQLALAPR
jgi:hypothetical protein